MDVRERVERVRERIARACMRAGRSPEEVTLVAVTKGVEPEKIIEAFEAGIREFGENRVQEMERKMESLRGIREAARWHMVGHLQTNKVKKALELFDTIQSVDSVKLAEAINRRAQRKVPVFIQVNVSGEPTKFGFSPQELPSALERIKSLSNLEIRGLMTIAPLTDDEKILREVFRKLRELRDAFGLEHLSMGMSNDFEIAVEEGATIVRIGRAIFGEEDRL